MVDVRKELSLIDKHIRQRNREAGESIMWFEFVPFGGAASAGWSLYDDIYDQGARGEGGRTYAAGIVLPTIYIEEFEDEANANEEGRQPVQNLRVVMLYKDVADAGLVNPWEYKEHLNDIFFYDARYYKVYTYMARGRLEREVIVTVEGFEVNLDQEFMFDPGPSRPTTTDLPWPVTFP